jgi:ribosomal protein L37AE/L43A
MGAQISPEDWMKQQPSRKKCLTCNHEARAEIERLRVEGWQCSKIAGWLKAAYPAAPIVNQQSISKHFRDCR